MPTVSGRCCDSPGTVSNASGATAMRGTSAVQDEKTHVASLCIVVIAGLLLQRSNSPEELKSRRLFRGQQGGLEIFNQLPYLIRQPFRSL